MLKKLAGQTAIYGLSSIVGRFLNYLLVPIYTRVLDPTEYGASSWFYAIAAFMAVIYTYGMETAFFRFTQKEDSDKEKVFSTSAISILATSLIFSGLIIFFATPLAHFTKNEGRELYFIYFAIIFAADAITTIPFAWLRHQNEPLRFAFLRLLSIGTNIGLNLFFYIVIPFFSARGLLAPLDTEGVSIKWMFIANVLSSIVVLPFFSNELKLLKHGLDKTLWREMLTYAFPLIFMGLAGMVNETLDRILLKEMIADQAYAEAQIGIYSANYKLSIIITLFIQAFRFGAEPFFFAQAKEKDSRQTYAKVMQYFMLVCATIFIGVLLYLDIFKGFIGKKYWEGLTVVPILLMANVFLGAYYNLSVWYKLTDRTQMGAVVSLIGAAITLILNWLWIPTMGYEGSAWATLICYFSMAAISFGMGQKYYPIPYPTRRIAAYLALALTAYFMSEMLAEHFGLTTLVKLAVNTLIFAVYLLVLYKMEEKQIQPLKTLILSKLKRGKP
ncbi:MAG: oligosaccharide flippase family protein [Saprospiraceae bacterium]|nr:oligosaccharide flippase family protein [Saprospiraceae bacterium]